MTNSSLVKTANLKPFKKGKDPRRNASGAMCAERAAWATKFNNALAKKLSPDEAADILIAAYKAKRPWAVAEVHERIMGKVTQPIETDQAVTYRVIYDDTPEPEA